MGFAIWARVARRFGADRHRASHDVHLEEIYGAVNTFVLICSSLTIVLAHHALGKNQVPKATAYVLITFVLGCVFMGIKAVEYKAKIDHAGM